MRAMILAAGRGERLRPVTDKLPKALVEVAGESLLEKHLRSLSECGVTHAVVNLDWLGDMICERIGGGHRFGLSVSYSPEFGHVLETAGGILRALPMLGDEPFCVVNADVFTDAVPALCDVRLEDRDSGHLIMVPKPGFKSLGDFDLTDGRLRNATMPEYTFSGMAVYRPQFLLRWHLAEHRWHRCCEALRMRIGSQLRCTRESGKMSARRSALSAFASVTPARNCRTYGLLQAVDLRIRAPRSGNAVPSPLSPTDRRQYRVRAGCLPPGH